MSHSPFPHPDPSRFAPLAAADLLLAYLAGQKSGLSAKMLAHRLSIFLDAEQAGAAHAVLVARGLASAEKAIALTPAGHAAATALLGGNAGTRRDRDGFVRRLLPACLGLDPRAGGGRLSGPEALKAAIIAVGFGLPKELVGETKAVHSELVWRTLKAGIGPLIGKGPFPEITTPGVTERVILAGLAGGSAKSVPEAISALACAATGLKTGDLNAVCREVIALALRNARPSGVGEPATPGPAAALPQAASRQATQASEPTEADIGETDFAMRVLQVAATLSTPPFLGRVAIAQVYDAFGREFADAGALQSFKERLAAAASAKQLQLARLDMPEHMDAVQRMRSETVWSGDRVHFVVTAMR